MNKKYYQIAAIAAALIVIYELVYMYPSVMSFGTKQSLLSTIQYHQLTSILYVCSRLFCIYAFFNMVYDHSHTDLNFKYLKVFLLVSVSSTGVHTINRYIGNLDLLSKLGTLLSMAAYGLLIYILVDMIKSRFHFQSIRPIAILLAVSSGCYFIISLLFSLIHIFNTSMNYTLLSTIGKYSIIVAFVLMFMNFINIDKNIEKYGPLFLKKKTWTGASKSFDPTSYSQEELETSCDNCHMIIDKIEWQRAFMISNKYECTNCGTIYKFNYGTSVMIRLLIIGVPMFLIPNPLYKFPVILVLILAVSGSASKEWFDIDEPTDSEIA